MFGFGYDIVKGIKDSFTPTVRREEKHLLTYTIGESEFVDKLHLKGKVVEVSVFKDDRFSKVRILTEE